MFETLFFSGNTLFVLVAYSLFVFSILVGVYAKRKKGRSGFGFFILSSVLTPVIGLFIALLASSNISNGNVIRLRMPKDSNLHSDEYRLDRYTHGDWVIRKKMRRKIITISTNRAFKYILKNLDAEKNQQFKESLIEARQGVVFSQ